MVMLRKLPLLAVAFLLQTTLVPAQSALLARKVFSSDSMSVLYPTLSPDEKWLVFPASISNQETRLMIQPLAGGPPRQLAMASGFHTQPRFTPSGDRLLFVSSLPQRNPTDGAAYLVSAPFDTRTGILTGAPRQITMDGVRQSSGWRNFAIAPDGQSIAYVGDGSNAIKVIPFTGGRARTIIEPPSLPSRIAWSPDGKFVSYELTGTTGFTRVRVSQSGGRPLVTVRSSETLGSWSADNEYAFSVAFKSDGSTRLRLFDSGGRLLGEVGLPTRQTVLYSAFAGSKFILGASSNAVATVKVVSVAGGPIRQISPGTSYEWPAGWSPDGELAYTSNGVLSQVTLRGDLKRQVRIPEDANLQNHLTRLQDGHLIYAVGRAAEPAAFRIMALRLADGSRTELVRDVLTLPCCEPIGPGGMYYGLYDGEFYYRTLHGNRVRLHAMRVGRASRLIGEIPAATIRGSASVFQSRIVYLEPSKDSIRLQLVVGTGRPPVTLATYGSEGIYTEFAWSHDGRQLAVSAMRPQSLSIYRFDDDGNLQGSPQVHQLPFEYWYETFWLPDGSGLTMIAQPRGAGVTEVAVVKLADPQHPLLLTKNDPVNKWGHALSPDGKFVSYASDQPKGSSIYLIDVAEMLKQVRANK
jgi:Tol biopolymer transport system component